MPTPNHSSLPQISRQLTLICVLRQSFAKVFNTDLHRMSHRSHFSLPHQFQSALLQLTQCLFAAQTTSIALQLDTNRLNNSLRTRLANRLTSLVAHFGHHRKALVVAGNRRAQTVVTHFLFNFVYPAFFRLHCSGQSAPRRSA